jgi:hypothetical protein
LQIARALKLIGDHSRFAHSATPIGLQTPHYKRNTSQLFKQATQEQIKKPAANQTVPEGTQQNPEAVIKQVSPSEGQVTASTSKQNDWPQTVKEINDTLLVIFTGVLALVGYLQWKTLRQHERWNFAKTFGMRSSEVLKHVEGRLSRDH